MNALGMIETMSIPLGIKASDAMMKAADVRLVAAQAVCAGKHIVLVAGEVASVKASVEAGIESAGETLVDKLIITSVHESVAPAINAAGDIGDVGAIGIMETYSLCSAVLGADCAVKTSDVSLIEVRLGRGLGGKAFIIITGDVAAVESAVEAVKNLDEVQGLLAQCVVIPAPHADIIDKII